MKKSSYLVNLYNVFSSPGSQISLLMAFVFFLFLFFVLSEIDFFGKLLDPSFNLHLFISLLPAVFTSFLLGGGYVIFAHYLFIAFLLAIYVCLFYVAFFTKKIFSFKSLTSSVASFFGLAIGVTCISCGAIAGVALMSVFGALGATVITQLDSLIFLFLGEIGLAISIYLLLKALSRY